MNSEPCVRFGMRISPKISEKPADSRNNSPPNVMLLTAKITQNVMSAASSARSCQLNRGRLFEGARGNYLASALLERREIAGVDRLREELLLVVGPELAHVLVGLDGLVDELALRLF